MVNRLWLIPALLVGASIGWLLLAQTAVNPAVVGIAAIIGAAGAAFLALRKTLD